MYHDPGARLAAFVARRVWHVGGDKTLVTLLHHYALLQSIAVIDGAFTFQQVGDGLDTLVKVGLGARGRGHRQNIHTHLARTDGLGRCTGTVSEALLADVGGARFDYRDPVVC